MRAAVSASEDGYERKIALFIGPLAADAPPTTSSPRRTPPRARCPEPWSASPVEGVPDVGGCVLDSGDDSCIWGAQKAPLCNRLQRFSISLNDFSRLKTGLHLHTPPSFWFASRTRPVYPKGHPMPHGSSCQQTCI